MNKVTIRKYQNENRCYKHKQLIRTPGLYTAILVSHQLTVNKIFMLYLQACKKIKVIIIIKENIKKCL